MLEAASKAATLRKVTPEKYAGEPAVLRDRRVEASAQMKKLYPELKEARVGGEALKVTLALSEADGVARESGGGGGSPDVALLQWMRDDSASQPD